MLSKSIVLQLLELIDRDQPCALSTVIEVSGSAPQVPGSTAIFGPSGLLAGTVGGGLTEYEVMIRSQKALEKRQSLMSEFDLSGLLHHGSDTVCGGNMSILTDASPGDHRIVFQELAESLVNHQPGILCTFVEEKSPDNLDIKRLWCTTTDCVSLPDPLRQVAGPEIGRILHQAVPGTFRVISGPSESPALKQFICLELVSPPPSLVIAGAGHVGKAVARTGKFLGFEVTIWDDRDDLANKRNIPEADNILNGSAEESLRNIRVNGDSYLVIVTRGHQHDAEVLRKWIKTRPAYLGMMGSRVKIAQMKQQFLEESWATPEEWDRVHTPIGLKIGAKTVEEIAISILSEIVSVKNQ